MNLDIPITTDIYFQNDDNTIDMYCNYNIKNT